MHMSARISFHQPLLFFFFFFPSVLFFSGRILTQITRISDLVLWSSDIVGRREVVLDRPETPLVITFYGSMTLITGYNSSSNMLSGCRYGLCVRGCGKQGYLPPPAHPSVCPCLLR
jgi:hypothetical protein